MLIKIAKEIAVNPKNVLFIGVSSGVNDDNEKVVQTTVFISGCPKGLGSDFSFEETLALLNGGSGEG